MDFAVFEDKFHHRNVFICEKCQQLTTHCQNCHVFVIPERGLVLPDGRVFCREDSRDLVLAEEPARELARTAFREVQGMLRDYPPVPDKSVEFHLVTREDFNKTHRRTPSSEDPSKLLGLTISRRDSEANWTHELYVLHGLNQDEFLAVCAHEFTHTWLNEREKKSRQLHADTQEGFCELMALKYARQMNFTNAAQRILDSEYTRGQVLALQSAEEKFRFHQLVRWISDGVDSWVDAEKLDRVAVLRDPQAETEKLWLKLPQQAVTPVPDKLALKGLSKVGSRRFAIVNNMTLTEGETTRIRVGNLNFNLQCVAIMDDRVQLREVGKTNIIELRLGAK